MLKLYHHPVSTCSQKVHLVLAEKSLTFDQHVINWTVMEHLQDWYLTINPNGVVPTLVHNGTSIIDSSVICEYLDEVFPNPSLTPENAADRARMRAWMRYFEEVPTAAIRIPSLNMLFTKEIKGSRDEHAFQKMTEKMPLRKHFYRQMNENGFSAAVLNESLDKLKACLVRVAQTLADGRTFLLGEYFTLADIVLTPSVIRMEDLELSYLWDDIPEVSRWLRVIKARPSFDIAYMPEARVNAKNYNLSQGNYMATP